MKPLGSLKQHYWLAKRMAQAGDVDLVEARARGDLDQAAWARMVQTCRGCEDPEKCRRWLDSHADAGEVPDLCANHDRFVRLADAQQLET